MAQVKSWTVSDDLWNKVEPLIPVREREGGRTYQRKSGAGRKPMASRQVFSAIVYVLRTGIQWKALPREFGAASAVHQHFQNWYRAGFFQKLWQAGLAEYDGMHGLPGSGRQPTEPWAKRRWPANAQARTRLTGEKKGRKRSLLVDGRGVPLSIAVSGANLHDSKLLDRTLARVVVQRPEVTSWKNQQYLCLDAGYVGYPASKIARKHISAREITRRRAAHQVSLPGLETSPLGGGKNPLLAQPIPQTPGQLREDRGQLYRLDATGRSPYLLEADRIYLRISS